MTYSQSLELVADVGWPAFVGIVMIAVVVLAMISGFRRDVKIVSEFAPFVLAFATLGVTTGFITAFSRTSAVGAVLPSVLALESTVVAYSFSKDSLARYRGVVPAAIATLAFATLIGMATGSTCRAKFDDAAEDTEADKLHYERVELECEKAQYLATLELWKQAELKGIAIGKPVHALPPAFPTDRAR